MKIIPLMNRLTPSLVVATFALLLPGCEKPDSSAAVSHQEEPQKEEKTEGLALLSDEDRKLAEEQKYCVVAGSPLGSMGAPFKVMIEDQPVFLCCQGCEHAALEDPKATLAKVAEYKAQSKTEASN